MRERGKEERENEGGCVLYELQRLVKTPNFRKEDRETENIVQN